MRNKHRIKGKEATRRINFFVNSMFVEHPESTQVLKMPSLTTLTPYYKEEVVSVRFAQVSLAIGCATGGRRQGVVRDVTWTGMEVRYAGHKLLLSCVQGVEDTSAELDNSVVSAPLGYHHIRPHPL